MIFKNLMDLMLILIITGVLYDLMVNDSSLPWQINVHFDKFPVDILFKFPNK